jgi:membrane protein
MRYIKAILRSFVDFFRDGGLMLAGSISYFTMMAIVPFCLLLVTIFGHFLGGNEELLRFFSAKLVGFFPKITHEITNELKKIISYKGIGQFTVILYAVLSYQLFSSLETATNVIFKTKAKRHFIISIVLSLFIITLIIAFILASFGATAAISMLKTLQEFFPDVKIGKITGFVIKFVVPLILVFLTAATLYIFLPKKRIRLSCALSGALFTAILLEAAKHTFTLYVVKVAKLGTIYGPLSAFVIFLLWVFYSSCIFLIGAEIVRNLEDSRKG